MSNDHVAKARTTMAVPVEQVWDALTNPEQIRKYMFGTDAASDWQPGSPITWRGEWKGKPYEDKGTTAGAPAASRRSDACACASLAAPTLSSS